MKLRIMSDLHFEFHRDGGKGFVKSLAVDPDEVLILPGDLATCWQLDDALTRLCKRFRHVVYLPGNHEYYHARPSEVHLELQRLANKLPNLHWLDCGTATIDGQRFVGGTLWFNEEAGQLPSRRFLNDFNAIEDFEPWVYREHARALSLLRKQLRADDVVLTHHLPSQRSVAAQYANSTLNPFFVSNVEGLIRERQPKLWVHGHTHSRCDYQIGQTRIVCNPFGYKDNEDVSAFDPHLTVQL